MNFQQEFNFILNTAAWPSEVIQLVQDPYSDNYLEYRGQTLFCGEVVWKISLKFVAYVEIPSQKFVQPKQYLSMK